MAELLSWPSQPCKLSRTVDGNHSLTLRCHAAHLVDCREVHPMSYTLAEAAAACGVNKSTVLRAVQGGRISGTRDDLGVWHVEAVELHRVFPPVASAAASTEAMPHHAPPDPATDALVAELRAVIADLRRDRDEWREQAQRLALPAPKPAQTWWQWLRPTG